MRGLFKAVADAVFDWRMARANSRTARRHLFARFMAKRRERLLFELEATMDACIAGAVAASEEHEVDLEWHFLRRAILLAECKLLLMTSKAGSRHAWDVALALHFCALPVTLVAMGIAPEQVCEMMEREDSDFREFVSSHCPEEESGLSRMLDESADQADKSDIEDLLEQ